MRPPRLDPKAAHAAALERAVACPCCGAGLVLYVLGTGDAPARDEDLVAFTRLYRQFRAEGRVAFETIEDAAQGMIEGTGGLVPDTDPDDDPR